MRQLLRFCVLGICAMLAPSAFADIVIGHVLPLSGADAATGKALRVGAKAYIDQVNAMGGVAGQKIVYVVSDDASQPAQTVIRARELIIKDNIFALLAGANPTNLHALAQSGVLRKYRVPMVSSRDGSDNPDALARARQVGLVELAPPQIYTPALLEEFKDALAKYGTPGEQPTSTALQGYISAKVMLGALRLLGDEPVRSEFYFLMQHMVPDLSNHLMRRGYSPA